MGADEERSNTFIDTNHKFLWVQSDEYYKELSQNSEFDSMYCWRGLPYGEDVFWKSALVSPWIFS